MKMNLADKAYYELKNRIIYLDLKPGTQLTEVDLSNELNISRTPIREALKQLSVEGFIEWTENKGNVVSPLTVENFMEIYQIRDVLENLSVKLATLNWEKDSDIDGLKTLLKKQLEMAKAKEIDARAFLIIDKNFHLKLLELSGNQLLINEMKKINDLYYRYNHFSVFRSRALLTTQEHIDIVDAIEQRDSRLAQSIMKGHLQVIRESILIGLAKRENTKET